MKASDMIARVKAIADLLRPDEEPRLRARQADLDRRRRELRESHNTPEELGSVLSELSEIDTKLSNIRHDRNRLLAEREDHERRLSAPARHNAAKATLRERTAALAKAATARAASEQALSRVQGKLDREQVAQQAAAATLGQWLAESALAEVEGRPSPAKPPAPDSSADGILPLVDAVAALAARVQAAQQAESDADVTAVQARRDVAATLVDVLEAEHEAAQEIYREVLARLVAARALAGHVPPLSHKIVLADEEVQTAHEQITAGL